MKVAKSLTREGFLVSTRGRSGGFRLSRSPGEIVVGDVVRKIEREIGLVECMRIKESACPIVPACRLPMLLNEATMAFLAVLDSRTLADLTAKNAALLPLLERAS
jgi:Rrf2 family nitric oxide-sensitive transcriptional repressor